MWMDSNSYSSFNSSTSSSITNVSNIINSKRNFSAFLNQSREEDEDQSSKKQNLSTLPIRSSFYRFSNNVDLLCLLATFLSSDAQICKFNTVNRHVRTSTFINKVKFKGEYNQNFYTLFPSFRQHELQFCKWMVWDSLQNMKQVPKSITTLTLNCKNYQQNCYNNTSLSLPPSLKTLISTQLFSLNLFNDIIFPRSLEELIIENYDYEIRECHFKFPNWIKKITFSEFGSCDPDQILFPSSLKELEFKNVVPKENIKFPSGTTKISIIFFYDYLYINKILNNLPLSLKYLKIDCHFGKIINSMKLPPKLETLIFGKDFNQCIKSFVLPNSLHTLIFGEAFNHSLSNVILPPSLKILDLGLVFKQQIDDLVLPQKLEELYFSRDLNQSIDHLLLPQSLRKIRLGARFNQNLSEIILPPSMIELRWGDDKGMLWNSKVVRYAYNSLELDDYKRGCVMIAQLAQNQVNHHIIFSLGGINFLNSLMRVYSSDLEILELTCFTLTFIKELQNHIHKSGILQTLLSLMFLHIRSDKNIPFITQSCCVIKNLLKNKHKRNINVIIAYGGINILINIMCKYYNETKILINVLKSLINLFSKNLCIHLFIELKGINALSMIMNASKKNNELIKPYIHNLIEILKSFQPDSEDNSYLEDVLLLKTSFF